MHALMALTEDVHAGGNHRSQWLQRLAESVSQSTAQESAATDAPARLLDGDD